MNVPINSFTFVSSLPEDEQDAYHILRHAIVGLYLQPGLVASIQDICDKCGFGRSPVRDALLRLEQEGLICMLPQRGVQISLIESKRTEQERFLRYSVEKEILTHFLANHTPTDILSLQHVILEQEELLARKAFPPRDFLLSDDKFHKIFYDSVHMQFCWKTVRNVTGHYQRVRLLSCMEGKHTASIIKQHRDLITSIQLNEIEKAENRLYKHLNRIDIEIPSLKKKYSRLFAGMIKEEKENPLTESDFLSSLATTY